MVVKNSETLWNINGIAQTFMKKMTESIGAAESCGFKEHGTRVVKAENKKTLELKMEKYSRQNSENELKENGAQSPCTESNKQYFELKQKPQYMKQPSECPLVDTDFTKKHSSVVIIHDDFNSKDSGFSNDTDAKKGQDGAKENCCLLTQIATFLISLVSLGLVTFCFYKMTQSDVTKIPEVIIGQSNQEALPAIGEKMSGSFKLDQYYLRDHKKIRWAGVDPSAIKPATDEPCLIVPVAGQFLVISRFTFKLPPGDDNTMLTHTLFLKSKTDTGEIKETAFRRQYVSVVEHKLKEDAELRKPSPFTQSFYFKAGDRVCTSVSNPELIYLSPIDNDVNIFRV